MSVIGSFNALASMSSSVLTRFSDEPFDFVLFKRDTYDVSKPVNDVVGEIFQNDQLQPAITSKPADGRRSRNSVDTPTRVPLDGKLFSSRSQAVPCVKTQKIKMASSIEMKEFDMKEFASCFQSRASCATVFS